MDFPLELANPAYPCITPGNAIPELAFFGNYGGRAWPVANKAIFIPFSLDETVIAYGMSWENGTSAPGNVDVGIYTLDGTRLVSSTPIAAATGLQFANIVDTTLTPDYYFMAMAVDSVTGLVTAAATSFIVLQGLGVCEQLVGVLPANATLVKATSSYLPAVAIHIKPVF